ncbi:myotubularin-related protein 6-like [Hydractinia symbiolongicarpus]|uniref:myotubularin-related protein 6-like n=1 Tax=Hydractinia symbiolongicarpus TaxID=13093 RepID=UPI0025512062|nr:myotubularin-related protein 6-like [Hydractinia symbiolongicarpus]
MSPLDYIRTPKVDNVKLVDSATDAKGVTGTLHLTATHVIFIDPHGAKETWILHSHIAEAERLPITARGSSIKIKTKTFRDVTFIITRERECADVFDTIIQLSNPVKIEDLFAFHYHAPEELTKIAGWSLYDAQTEFRRMEVPQHLWMLTKLNNEYKLCGTYPRDLYLPTSVSNDVITKSAQFRSKGRLPALSYYCKATETAICRCAQPMAGLNNRCTEDEQLLQAIITSTPGSSRMYIVDTRPKINAMANRAAGKGYENVANYENVDFHFIGIENIHVMRQSLQKMIEVFDVPTKELTMSTYLRGLEDSGWLKHIKAVMDTSLFIAKAVYFEKRSVLVHCSDGWDRTAQTCSLSEILLDAYYRTIHGFQVLVEKEWLAFGHKFVHRCGLLSGDPKEISPIFTQFLESVWQLMNQYPAAFQFNERFLLEIHEHVYSSQFGTFLGNCEKERKQKQLSQKTYSLWGYMWHNLPDYVNPFYKDGEHGVLQPSTSPQQLRFWRSLYNRYINNVHPRQSVPDYVCSLNDHNDSLRDHIRYLEKRIDPLHQLKDNNRTNSDTNLLGVHNNSGTDWLSKSSVSTHTPKNTNIEDSDLPGDSHSSKNLVLNERYILETAEKDGIEKYYVNIRKVESVPDLTKDIPIFALNWSSVRDVSQCSCGKPIDSLSRKYHCWNCGKVFCARCVDKSSQIPGHYSGNKVPVCKPCYKILRR